MKTLRIDSYRHEDPEGVAAFRTLEREAPYGPARPPADDAHLLIARQADTPAARLSYRIVPDMHGAPELTGVVGHYEANDDEAGAELLRHAVSLLKDAGAELVIGPMDSTTWDRYRLALPTPEAGDPPPFLTEPVNPATYPAQFEAAGFAPVAHYVSRIIEDLDALADRTRDIEKHLTAAGHRIEPMNPDRFGGTLDGLYDLSLRAFATNSFFSPIKRAEFQSMYRPVRSFVDPELVLLARDAEDTVIGFVFAMPDLLDRTGDRPTRVVVKSLAVDTAARGAGIGSFLVHELHRRAAERGYRSAIHALMHVDNPSVKISKYGGDLYRRYALFGREP
jgi:ribosomal protein S18 acetylase RimI-like enzyme